MYDQPRYEPFEASTFFDDGTSSRPLVAGTVPRTDPRNLPDVADRNLLLTGLKDGLPSRSAALPGRSDRCSTAARDATGSTARPATASSATARG